MCLSFSLLLYILLELSRDNILTHFEKQINYYYWETTILRIFFRYIIDKKLSSDLVALRFHFISKIFLIVYQTSIKFFFHDATNFFARSFFLSFKWLINFDQKEHAFSVVKTFYISMRSFLKAWYTTELFFSNIIVFQYLHR